MEILQECWNALAAQKLSTCQPLGLDLGAWFGLFGASVLVIAAFFWRVILSGVKAVFGRSRNPEPIPRLQTATLFGRDADIARIDAALKGSHLAVAITGQGGIGKTALAEEFGRLRMESKRYRDCVLVSTASETDLANDLRTMAKLLHVPEESNPKTMIDLTYKAMAESGDRWLIVLDNADDEESQRLVLKNLRTADRIDHLITSRIGDWHDRAVAVDLGLLPPDDAVEMLRCASGREADADLRRLAIETLERLPLALAVAGADLRQMNIGIGRYGEEFDKRLRAAPQGRAYEKSIYAAVTGSLERLSTDARAFMKLAAYMAPGDIDPGHLVRGAEAIEERGWEDLPAPFAALAEGGVTLQAAVAECTRHSLLVPGKWKEEDTLRIHRLTQLVLRDWMGEAARGEIVGLAGRIGRAQFTDNVQYDTGSWPRCRRLAPHARALAEFGAEAEGPDAKLVAGFVHETALFLNHATGDLRLVMRLYDQNLGNVERACGADSSDYAAALGNLASAQDDVSRGAGAEEAARLDRQAEANFKTAIEIQRGKKEHDLARAYTHNNLGGFYRERGRFNDALNEYTESRRILEEASAGGELLGSAHGNLGVLYSGWAGATSDEKQKAEYQRLALTHKEQALKLTRGALGEMSFGTATRHHNIAAEYRIRGDGDKALASAIRAAAIPLAMLEQGVIDEPEHPELHQILNGLESILPALDRDPKQAESLARAEIPKVLAEHAAWKKRKDEE